MLARQAAADANALECIQFRDGFMTEGSASNVWVVRDGQVLGVLGVIGPTRMAYERVIPVVQAAAAALGQALQGPDAASRNAS